MSEDVNVSITLTPIEIAILMTGLQEFINSFKDKPPEDEDEKNEFEEAKLLITRLKDSYRE